MTELLEIEKRIAELPPEKKRWLLERLTHQLHEETAPDPRLMMLQDMANDPDIRRELRAIDAGFAAAETDGMNDK